MKVPPWLESLLSTAFFTICPRHRDTPRNECNMYCLDCMNDPFCFYCRSSRHKDHLVIQVHTFFFSVFSFLTFFVINLLSKMRLMQIRRSSYHDVVRVDEIQKVLDTSGVQTYVINSARVVFLNERPQPKTISSSSSSKGVSHLCEICNRSLLDPFRFCSLGCKVSSFVSLFIFVSNVVYILVIIYAILDETVSLFHCFDLIFDFS
ncbi:hypothetical protein PTKIN_Ptkin03bG0057500 [Pterospermum kingtungense]